MAEQRKGFWYRLFGGGQGCCCNVRIEEVPEEDQTRLRPLASNSCCDPASGESGVESRNQPRSSERNSQT